MNAQIGLRRATTDGLIDLFASLGLGTVAKDDSVFTEDDTALVPKFMPDFPDRAVVFHIYDSESEVNPRLRQRALYLQVRGRSTRTDPQSVDDLMDQVQAVLDGKHAFNVGGVYLERCTFRNSASLGVDAQGRQERTDNYTLLLQVDNTHPQ